MGGVGSKLLGISWEVMFWTFFGMGVSGSEILDISGEWEGRSDAGRISCGMIFWMDNNVGMLKSWVFWVCVQWGWKVLEDILGSLMRVCLNLGLLSLESLLCPTCDSPLAAPGACGSFNFSDFSG